MKKWYDFLLLPGIFLYLFIPVMVFAGTVRYTYNDLNRLIRVEYVGVVAVEYEYDVAGNRILQAADSDADLLRDSLENTMCTDPNDADTDDDGIPDGLEDKNKNGAFDPGETHPCNVDTDGDGIQDGTELGYTLADIGPDTDPNVFQPDLDPETETDPLDSDSDGDAIMDGVEDPNHNGKVDPGETNPGVYDPNADISVEKSVDNFRPYIGDHVVFTITVTNNGPDNATAIQVTDQLPGDRLYYVDDDSGGFYDPATGIWSIGGFLNGETIVLKITVGVDFAGQITNIATRTDSNPMDVSPANDWDDASLIVRGPMPWLQLLLLDD